MFGFLKKKTETKTVKQPQKTAPVVDFDHLDEDGELPWGWVTHYKAFIDKINNEFNYFMQQWSEAKDHKSPIDEYGALKSFLIYMDDVQKLCDRKGECFSFWCREYLIKQEWKKKLQNRLTDLEANMDDKLKEYNEKVQQQNFEALLTDEMIFEAIRQNEGMLQKDLCKLFPYPKAISSKLYFMEKEGKIERIKSGNSYTLKIK